jgi:uncharacterized protein with HEPN domain
MPHRTRKLLLDVSLSCQEIIEFTDGKSFEDFHQDRMLQLAIEREFEIIGEALHRLSRVNEATLSTKFLSTVKL